MVSKWNYSAEGMQQMVMSLTAATRESGFIHQLTLLNEENNFTKCIFKNILKFLYIKIFSNKIIG